MGQGAEDADAAAEGLEAQESARRTLYGTDLSLMDKVRLNLGRGLHTQGAGTTVPLKSMTDVHLRNAIERGYARGGEFWELCLPVLEAEQRRRTPGSKVWRPAPLPAAPVNKETK